MFYVVRFSSAWQGPAHGLHRVCQCASCNDLTRLTHSSARASCQWYWSTSSFHQVRGRDVQRSHDSDFWSHANVSALISVTESFLDSITTGPGARCFHVSCFPSISTLGGFCLVNAPYNCGGASLSCHVLLSGDSLTTKACDCSVGHGGRSSVLVEVRFLATAANALQGYAPR
jgi:hypothetical protein